MQPWIRPPAQARSGVSLSEAQAEGLPSTWDSWNSKLVPTSESIGMIYRSDR